MCANFRDTALTGRIYPIFGSASTVGSEGRVTLWHPGPIIVYKLVWWTLLRADRHNTHTHQDMYRIPDRETQKHTRNKCGRHRECTLTQ